VGLASGQYLLGNGIPPGTTISAVSSSANTITLSTAATATGTVTITAGTEAYTLVMATNVPGGAGASVPTGTITVFDTVSTITPTNQPVTAVTTPPCPTTGTSTSDCILPPAVVAVLPIQASSGLAIFVPPTLDNAIGVHQFNFAYSGDSNFQPSILQAPSFLLNSAGAAQPTTLQSAVTAACAYGSTATVVIEPGYVLPTGSTIAGATGCATVAVLDYHILPAQYYAAGTSYATGVPFAAIQPTTNLGAVFPVGPLSTAPQCSGTYVPTSTSAGTQSNCMLVDTPDFSMISNTNGVPTSLVQVFPGCLPSGNGLPSVVQSNYCSVASSFPGTAVYTVYSLEGEVGAVTFSCLPIGNPYSNPPVLPPAGAVPTLTPASYIQCSMTPNSLTLTSNGTLTSVLSVWTPATEPVNYNFYSQIPTRGSATVLAFLPLGVLAFCFRRRRRLSKALWMLFAIAAVSAGMSGCGGNQVDFYTPIPAGEQYVTVTITGQSSPVNPPAPTAPTYTRQYTVPIYID
jgi:hypothetical protein